MSERIIHRRTPTPEERQQARDVAAFVEARGLTDEPLLVVLPIVSGMFPDISLDVALVGVVCRDLLGTPPTLSLSDMPVEGNA